MKRGLHTLSNHSLDDQLHSIGIADSSSVSPNVDKAIPCFRLLDSWPIYGAAALAIGLVALISHITTIPLETFLRDTFATLGASPLVGLQSNLGVLAWFSSGAICLFCAFALRSLKSQSTAAGHQPIAVPLLTAECSKNAAFFQSFGWLSIGLALDDFFVIHEYVTDVVSQVSHVSLYGAYFAIAIGLMLRFHKQILQSRMCGLLAIALAFFTLSITVDTFQDYWISRWRIFFEDGCKFLGIVSWSSYFFYAGVEALSRQITQT